MTMVDRSKKQKLRAGMLTPSNPSHAEIKKHSAARFENEDTDKYSDKKVTTMLKKLPFRFMETPESTCNKPEQHPLVETNATFVSKSFEWKKALAMKSSTCLLRTKKLQQELIMICNHYSCIEDGARKKGLCCVCLGEHASCTGFAMQKDILLCSNETTEIPTTHLEI